MKQITTTIIVYATLLLNRKKRNDDWYNDGYKEKKLTRNNTNNTWHLNTVYPQCLVTKRNLVTISLFLTMLLVWSIYWFYRSLISIGELDWPRLYLRNSSSVPLKPTKYWWLQFDFDWLKEICCILHFRAGISFCTI